MWEFLKTVLERHGLSAAVLLTVIGAAGFAIRALYKRNQEMTKELMEVQESEHKKRSDMREAVNVELTEMKERHRKELADVRENHQAAIARIQEQWRKDEAKCANRIDELQEKRIQEAQDFVREATRHVASTREEIGKIAKAMETLTDVMTGRRS